MPELKVNRKLKKFLTCHKPLKIAIGGRGSGKSVGFGDMLTFKMATEQADIYCLREYQDSLSDSVHRVFKGSISDRLRLPGWGIQQNCVISPEGAVTKYVGAARNPDSIQSAEGYKYSWFEEAHRASQASLDKLLPTILRNTGSECWFSGNPQSSGDPFSQRFIVPYLDALDKYGIFEDELHLVVVVNWRDNPWWNESQEILRAWDYENLSRAKYDWIWEGKFNDSVEDSIIKAEWFDACIDAHEKLKFKPRGAVFVAHDPADMGENNESGHGDAKGVVLRHGSVVLEAKTNSTDDVNTGCDWALEFAIQNRADYFIWDGVGIGLSLRRQISQALHGRKIEPVIFKGSMSPEFEDRIYDPIRFEQTQERERWTNSQTFKNLRSQRYWMLRDRIYRTFLAVTEGEFADPDDLISFSSKISELQTLRSEVCRIPRKPNASGLIQIMSKPEMKALKIKSPNLADSVVMSLHTPIRQFLENIYVPVMEAEPEY